MSKLEIEIPDDRWFSGEWEIRPQDKQLCVVIPKGLNPEIMIWKEYKNTNSYFIGIHSINGKEFRRNIPDILFENIVDRWKPLGLPADVNKRILTEIKKWVEEDE